MRRLPGDVRGPMKYERVRTEIERALREGRYKIGHRLEPERELARSFDVSLLTIRQALSMLEEDGLISREHGRGTFVRRLSPMQDVNQPQVSNSIAYLQAEDATQSEGAEESYRYYRDQLRSLDAHLVRHGRHLVVAHVSAQDMAEGKLPPALEQGVVAGVIIDGFVEDIHIDYLKRQGLPVVVLGNHPVRLPVCQVRQDMVAAAYLMTRAMFDAKASPVYFATEPFQFYYTHELFEGYSRACREAGQDERVCVLTETGDDLPALRRMIESVGGPFGLLLHYNAAHVLIEIYGEYGLDPVDHPVAIFGFADYITPEMRRKLNVSTGDAELASEVAVELMEDLLVGGEPESVALVPELTSSREEGLLHMELTWHRPEGEKASIRTHLVQQSHIPESTEV